jgi:exosortase
MVESDLRRLDRVAPALAIGFGAIAYHPLLASALHAPTFHQLETWLFRPSQLPALLVLGVAGWLLWRRRERLIALPDRRDRGTAIGLASAAVALFAWATLTRSADVLFVSLSAAVLAFGSAARGRAGARALLLPALALGLGIGIPLPLRDEIVWSLQRATAIGSQWLLVSLGRELTREGVVLRSAEHSFQVIDGCSGLQGIATLLLVAILVGELLALSAGQRGLLAAIAPGLGYALNTVRIAYIAGSPNPEAYAGLQGDHTPQGLALLAGGTALLYGLGRVLARGSSPAAVPPRASQATRPMPWRSVATGLGLLAALSLALPPFALPADAASSNQLRFPEQRSFWKSAPIGSDDPFFFGTLVPGQSFHRRYQRGTGPKWIDTVDLFIAVERDDGGDAYGRWSSKLQWPGPDWNVERRLRARIWDLGTEAELAVAERATGTERAVIYTWRPRDRGLWRESWRSLLALEASPFRRERKRAVVQLVAYSPWRDDPVALDRARLRLDRFIALFRDELAAL